MAKGPAWLTRSRLARLPWLFGGSDPDFGVYANQYFARINARARRRGEWIRGASSCKAARHQHHGPDGFGRRQQLRRRSASSSVMVRRSCNGRSADGDERSNIIVQPWRDTSLGSR